MDQVIHLKTQLPNGRYLVCSEKTEYSDTEHDYPFEVFTTVALHDASCWEYSEHKTLHQAFLDYGVRAGRARALHEAKQGLEQL